ncbi:site-specific integrase [Azohydromonas sediminis]|uniref:site-specific integrase n=1 Tax=Azohydromonas sediminis TaxID=2259674 RepID=UPI0013C3325D|nr:site-specific integrase [Azohydromonas sediminis]
MAKLPGLFKRGGVYQLRTMIPKDLQGAFGGRCKLVESLGVTDADRAKVEGTVRRATHLAEFERMRSGRSPQRVDKVTPELAKVLAKRLAATRLEADRQPSTEEATAQALLTVAHTAADDRQTSAQPSQTGVAVAQRAPHPAESKPVTLRDVFKRWKGIRQRSPDTVAACERALSLFEGKFGQVPVQQITRPMGDEVRAWLQTLGTSSKTAHIRLTYLKSLLVYAYRDLELIPRQPWEGLDIDYRTEKPRKPWTEEEMRALFGLPLFQSYQLPKHSKAGGAAAYWVPILGLYTGARVGELCQLRVVDIENGKNGAFISINEEAEGARVKSAAGIRRVPIHSEVVRLGFLDYVAGVLKAAGGNVEASLWPQYKARKGKPGGYFSDWFNAFHKAATGNPKAPVFHALRHTVRTALHAAKVDRETISRITGHETDLSEVERAYTHVADKDLKEAVEKLRFPAVALPVVKGNG